MRIRSTENTLPLRAVDLQQPDPVRGSPSPGVVDIAPQPDNLVVGAFETDDAFARAARSLRMSIAAATSFDGSPVRSVALLGIDAADETSMLAASLAQSYARTGVTAVLVDANYAGATRHVTGDRARSPSGLAAVLNGELDARSAVTPTSIDGLFVLPLGALSDGKTIPSSGEQFHRRVKPLLESYAFMIVDAGTSDEDPPALCEALDAVVLVVRRNRTTIAQAQHYIGRLVDMKIRPVGTLIVD